MIKLVKVYRGCYETEDGQHRLVKTPWDGPKGGTYYLWEHARPDMGSWVITSEIYERRLRDSRKRLEKMISDGAI